MNKKRKWLTFILSMIPGLGHLYLGFNRQGLQIMIGACTCIVLIESMPMIFPFALSILWFYQLFDALQRVNWIRAAAAEHERMMMGQESFGYPWTERDWIAMNGYSRDSGLNPFWLGGGCLIVGMMVLFVNIFPGVWTWMMQKDIGSVLLAFGLIGYGLWLLKKKPGTKEGSQI
ncbi:hypothetical protein [Paenibacillus pini]